jgi:hypothetical protein
MINISFDVIAVSALATALVTLVYAFSSMARLRSRLEQQDDTIKSLQKDVATVCSGAVNMGGHLAQLDQRTHQILQRQDQLELQEPAQQSYRHAAKMLHKGAALDEVVSNCGLARGEAELIALAQRLEKAS